MEEKDLNSWSEFENEIKNLEQLRKEKAGNTGLEGHNYFLEGNLIRVGSWKQLGNDIVETRQI